MYIYNIYISVLSGRKQHVRLKAESQKTPRLASKLAISARLSLKQPALDVSLMASGLDPLNIQWLPIQCPRCPRCPRCPSCWLLGNTAASSHGWVPAIGCKSIMVRSLCNGCREHPAAESFLAIRNSTNITNADAQIAPRNRLTQRFLWGGWEGPSFHLSHDHCSAWFSYCCGQCDVDRRGRITTAPNQFTWHLLGDPGLRLSCPSTSILEHQLLQA